MPCRNIIVALWCTFVSSSIASFYTATPTSNVAQGLTTPPPKYVRGAGELRRKRDTSQYVCGSDSLAEYAITCNENDLVCKGTIFGAQTAFVYCSTSGVVNQEVLTTAVSDWPATKDCPTSTRCCYGTLPAVVTDLYVASGYTMTGWHCDTAESTVTLNPAVHVLDPPSFSASLARLTASSSSSGIPTSTSPIPSSSGGATTSSKQEKPDSGTGMSSGTKIGIGAGVGAGLGIVLIAGAAFFFWRRHQKSKERVPEISQARGMTPQLGRQSWAPPYSPAIQQSSAHVSYQEAQFKQDASPGQQVLQQPPKYDQYEATELDTGDARMAAGWAGQNPTDWDQPHELPDSNARSPT